MIGVRLAAGLAAAGLLWHWLLEPWQQALTGALIVCLVAWSSVRSLRAALLPLERDLRTASRGEGATLERDTGLRELLPLTRIAAEAQTAAESRVARSTEQRYELERMLDSMPEAVAAVDAAGRLQWINDAMRSLLPDGGEGSPRLGHALVHIVRDPEVLAAVDAALAGLAVAQERRARTVFPGRTFEVNAAPMPQGGAVVILRDITPAEQMERTQRDFVANVSHELRTPLTSITGYVETLVEELEDAAEREAVEAEAASPTYTSHLTQLSRQDGITNAPLTATPGPLIAEQREFLGTILRNAQRMNRLIDDLLELSRVESDEYTVHLAPLQAPALMDEAILAVAGLLPEDGSVQLVPGGVVDATVKADADAAVRVLTNLLENAMKYGRNPAGTRVEVSATLGEEPRREGATAAGAMVCFTVRDWGSGISSEHLGRLFERFYRVDKARSRDSGGTGLGLAIARRLVELQGGEIWCESEVGLGSAFRFTLPLAFPEEATPALPAAPPQDVSQTAA